MDRLLDGRTAPYTGGDFYHLANYHFFKEIFREKVAVDIGCGTGYGSALIAEYAQKTIGIDVSQAAVDFCNSKYGSSSLTFSVASAESLPFDNDCLDLICFFEVVEHLEKPDVALREIHRVLKQSGLLLLSTPNVDNNPYRFFPLYPFHEREYTLDELRDLLERNGFRIDDIYGKRVKGEEASDSLSAGNYSFKFRLLATFMRFRWIRLVARLVPGRLRALVGGHARQVPQSDVFINKDDISADDRIFVCTKRQ